MVFPTCCLLWSVVGVLIAISFLWGIYSADPANAQYNEFAASLESNRWFCDEYDGAGPFRRLLLKELQNVLDWLWGLSAD